jgi:hypothetical protein
MILMNNSILVCHDGRQLRRVAKKMTLDAVTHSDDVPDFVDARLRRSAAGLRFVTEAHLDLVAAKHARLAADTATASCRLQEAVDAARDAGTGWTQIGDALGIRRGNAYKRFHKRSASPPGNAPSL